MTFATQIALAAPPKPVYILEFEGDEIDSSEFDSVSNWIKGTDVANLAADTTDAKAGTGSIGWDKTGTASTTGQVYNAGLESFGPDVYQWWSVWVKIPTTTAGTASNMDIFLGKDISNYYRWRVAAANWAAAGEWQYFRLSLNELDTVFTHRAAVGSPGTDSWDTLFIQMYGTSTAYTYTGARVDALRGHGWRYSTSTITTARADTKQGWMTPPKMSPHIYESLNSTLGSASAVCQVVDDDDATVIGDISTYAMQGRGAKILMGFEGDAETDDNYNTIFDGLLQSYPPKGRLWSFTLQDNLSKLRKPFMQDATTASPVTISGQHAITTFLQLLLSTGNGNNNSTYDTLSAVRGIGYRNELVDVDAFEDIENGWRGAWGNASFTWRAPERSLFDWFLKEICRAFALVPVITKEGKLSIKAAEEGLYPGGTSLVDFDKTNILIDSLPQVKPDFDKIRNQVRVLYDWDATDKEYDSDTGDDYQNTDSVSRYGLKELEVKSKGITETAAAQKTAIAHYTKLGDGAPPIKLQTLMSEYETNMGDLVQVTHDQIADIEGGSYSLSSSISVVEGRGFDPSTGRMSWVLAQTHYRSGNYRLISSLSVDYDSGTAAQKASYGWIADGSDQLGAANDTAHLIGP